MKKIVFMLLVSSALFLNSTAFAAGIGAFIDVSVGSGEAEWDSDYDSWDIDSSMVAGGLVFDTALTNENPFNYRFNIGIAHQELEDDYDEELDSTGIYVENIFGFALMMNEDFRWWAGPLVRIGYYSGESDMDSLSYSSDIDFDYVEFGFGAVTGFNFKAGNVVISPSVGVRYSAFAGEGDIKEIDHLDGYTYTYDEDIEAYTVTAFANLAVLF
ncbi:MAG: hypothetical protein J7K75_02130 [Desulfuromonas sp.]|nr:hypothetical protein [Desulfuromonas sp.]